MEFTASKIHNLFLFSTTLSLIGIIAAIIAKLSNISLIISALLFIVHIPFLWIVQRKAMLANRLTTWMQKSAFAQEGFLVCLSIFSTGLGFLYWIFLFEPGSQIRDVLILISPIIGWGVGLALFMFASKGAVLNREDENKKGLLIGAILFSVVGHLFLFWLSKQIFSFTIDDAYITFRYSKNLAMGFGPTYNPGLHPVEGYTTFLWMLVMTLPHFVGVSVSTFSKVLGILLTCGTFGWMTLLTFTLTREFSNKARIFFSAFATFVLAMLPITSIHAIAGMETSLFIFLLTLMVYMITKGILDKTKVLYWSPLVGLAIGMTRPEGNAIALLLLVCGWFFSDTELRKHLLWYSLLLYILPGVIYFLWRVLYYDLILPLPFYMKVLHGGKLFGGANEVGTYLIYLLPSISVLFLVAILRMRKGYLAVAIPATFLIIFYLFPVHAMGFDWRFIYPATPFIAVLVAIGGLIIFDLLNNVIQTQKPWEIILIVGLFLIGLGNLENLNNSIRNQIFYGDGINEYREFGTLLSKYNNKHEMTLAIGDAGTVPYYSDWQVIDLFGLNSTEVAFGTVPLYTLVFEKQSTDLILISSGPNPNRISEEHAGAQRMYDEALQRGMEKIGVFPFGRVNNIWVLGYPDNELASYLLEEMDFIEAP